MPSLNEVKLIGNVGQEPEIRSFDNGGRVANFSLATTEYWTDKKSGERKEATEWHRIVVTNEGLIKTIEKHVKKGSMLYVAGMLKTREWEKEGVKRHTTEILLRPYEGNMKILSWPEGKTPPADESDQTVEAYQGE